MWVVFFFSLLGSCHMFIGYESGVEVMLCSKYHKEERQTDKEREREKERKRTPECVRTWVAAGAGSTPSHICPCGRSSPSTCYLKGHQKADMGCLGSSVRELRAGNRMHPRSRKTLHPLNSKVHARCKGTFRSCRSFSHGLSCIPTLVLGIHSVRGRRRDP